MWLSIILWIVAVLLIIVGLTGTIIPALPGLPMIFFGAWLAGYIDDYQKIGVTPIVIIGVLTVIGLIIDWVGQSLGAKKAGATKL